MDKVPDRLKIVLLLSQNIYALELSHHLLKNQSGVFEVVGIIRQSFRSKIARPTAIKDKIKEIIQKQGIWKSIFYLIVKRWFVSPNSAVNKILRKLSPKKYIRYFFIDILVKDFNIPYLITDNINDDRSKKFLKDLKPDLGIVCGTGIIKDYIFTIPKFGCVNYHAGIVPKYRGCEPIFWQLYYKDDVGYTIHKIDKGVDTGEIILKKITPFKKTNDLWKTMFNIKKEMSKDCAKEIVEIILKLKQTGRIESYPQDNKAVSFFYHPNSEQKKELETRFLNTDF